MSVVQREAPAYRSTKRSAAFEFARKVLLAISEGVGRYTVKGVVRAWIKRRRARAELLTYLDSDHRAAADMGSTRSELEAWVNKPFWRD